MLYMFYQIRTELEQHMNCNLKEYKEFIDNEMLLILGQMDKATLIFDHVYLVGQLFLIMLHMQEHLLSVYLFPVDNGDKIIITNNNFLSIQRRTGV